MTFFAWYRNMVGHKFGIGDIAMTGAAFLWCMRQKGVMGIVTRHAGFAWIVLLGNNLRKSGRPRCVVTMTERAISASARSIRSVLKRLLHMQRGRAMADLASNPLVVRTLLKLENIFMTIHAGLITCIDQF
jgi:hypothetical protein